MEQRSISTLGLAGQMQFTLLASSHGRGWVGFDAALHQTSGGFCSHGESARYGISMYVGRPVTVACRCDGSVRRGLLTPGSIDIVPLGYASSWEEDGPTTVFSAHIEPSLLQSTAETMGINADTVTVAPSMQTRDQKIEHIAWALKAEIESSTPYDRLYADSLGTALAAHLLRRNMPAQPIPPKYGLGKRQLRRVVDYISAHLASDLSLLEMAEVAGASPSHFRFLFKCSTGVPLHQYVIRCRVQSAMQLLSRRSLTLNDVAAQCGFADQSHMARCMRRVIGMTPTAYLRNI